MGVSVLRSYKHLPVAYCFFNDFTDFFDNSQLTKFRNIIFYPFEQEAGESTGYFKSSQGRYLLADKNGNIQCDCEEKEDAARFSVEDRCRVLPCQHRWAITDFTSFPVDSQEIYYGVFPYKNTFVWWFTFAILDFFHLISIANLALCVTCILIIK